MSIIIGTTVTIILTSIFCSATAVFGWFSGARLRSAGRYVHAFIAIPLGLITYWATALYVGLVLEAPRDELTFNFFHQPDFALATLIVLYAWSFFIAFDRAPELSKLTQAH